MRNFSDLLRRSKRRYEDTIGDGEKCFTELLEEYIMVGGYLPIDELMKIVKGQETIVQKIDGTVVNVCSDETKNDTKYKLVWSGLLNLNGSYEVLN